MKVCMAGLGSIGQRHLKNMSNVLTERGLDFTVDALRIGGGVLPGECMDMLSKTYCSCEDLPENYDVIFITNPTACHYDSVGRMAGKTRYLFVEKPVFDCYRDIENLHLEETGIYYVACPLRHKKVMKYMKDLIDNGEKINSVRAISSSYLPDWRKGSDYRLVYSAKKDMGGGVELDLIHEWDYIAYLFGLPEKMFKLTGRYSDLEIDSNDIAVYIARYADKIVELHLDYFGTETVRQVELIGNRKKYSADINANRIKIFENGKEKQTISFGADDFYLTEMNYFFDLVLSGNKSFNEIEQANELLKFVLGG